MKILIALFAMALAYVPSTSVGADRVAQAGPVSPWECSNDMTAGEKNLADAVRWFVL